MRVALPRVPGAGAACARAVPRCSQRAAPRLAQPPCHACPSLLPLASRRLCRVYRAAADEAASAPAAAPPSPPTAAAQPPRVGVETPPPGAPPPPSAALPELRSLALALRTLSLLRRATPALLLLTAASAAAEQGIAFASFALLALLGVPDASYVTLAVGVSGICAGYAVGAFAKGAAYVALRDVDSPPAAAPPLLQRAQALLAAAPRPRAVLEAELRRLISVAWQGFLTFPVPVFAVPKALDLAILMPLLALERDTRPDAPHANVAAVMARSAALLAGRRRHLLGAVLWLSLAFAAALAVGAAALFAAVPSLVTALVPTPLLAMDSGAAGDVVASMASGEAFAKLFETGTDAQRAALSLGLAGGAVLRWAAVAAVRCLAYVAWREAAARGPAPRKQHPALEALDRRVAPVRQKAQEAFKAATDAARSGIGLGKKP